MLTRTYQQLMDAARELSGFEGTDTFVEDTHVLVRIEEAIERVYDIAARFPSNAFEFLGKTAELTPDPVSPNPLTLPSDFRAMVKLYESGGSRRHIKKLREDMVSCHALASGSFGPFTLDYIPQYTRVDGDLAADGQQVSPLTTFTFASPWVRFVQHRVAAILQDLEESDSAHNKLEEQKAEADLRDYLSQVDAEGVDFVQNRRFRRRGRGRVGDAGELVYRLRRGTQLEIYEDVR